MEKNRHSGVYVENFKLDSPNAAYAYRSPTPFNTCVSEAGPPWCNIVGLAINKTIKFTGRGRVKGDDSDGLVFRAFRSIPAVITCCNIVKRSKYWKSSRFGTIEVRFARKRHFLYSDIRPFTSLLAIRS